MIEVTVDSIQVSLMSQHRVVVLKDTRGERYLPIWIGPCEADAIAIELRDVEVARPLTHDLLKTVIYELGGSVSHVLVSDLENDTFYACIVMEVNGQRKEIDSRPSDAVALAVRVGVPIFVDEDVMERAGIVPEEDLTRAEVGKEELSAFREFVNTLDLEGLDE